MKIARLILFALTSIGLIQCSKGKLFNREDKIIDKILAKGGQWYVNYFEINGIDSTQNIYPGKEKETIVIVFGEASKKSPAGDYMLSTRSYTNWFNVEEDNNTLHLNGRGFFCGCPQNPGCIRDIFLQEVPGNRMIWYVSMPADNELVLERQLKNNYKIVMSRDPQTGPNTFMP